MTLPPKLSQSSYNTATTRKTSRLSLPTLLSGIFIGFIISIAFTILLFNMGFFDQFYVCLAEEKCEECPSMDLFAPLLATCVVTPMPTPTATPDLQATATAACGEFESQFLGTPCPGSSTP